LYAFHLYLHSFPTRRSSDLTIHCWTSPTSCSRTWSVTCHSSTRTAPCRAWSRCPTCCDRSSSTRWAAETNGATPCRPPPSGEERSEEHTSELQSRENLVCRL